MNHRNCLTVLFALMMALLSPGPFASDLDAPLHEIPERPMASDFSLPDMDGEVHTLADYRGKVVVLNFWATWCPPCRYEMPSMQTAWEALRDRDIVFLAVDVGEDEDTIFTFTADYPVDFPLLLDRDSQVIRQWEVRGLPTTFVIDPDGRVVYRAVGGRDWNKPEFVRQLLDLRKSESNGP